MDTVKLKSDIDAACVEHFREGHRWHMGASIIGHECQRYVWNTFRWLKAEEFSGRMYRLFERGQLEEQRFVMALAHVGIDIAETDPITSEQYRITAHNNHFGGSLDGISVRGFNQSGSDFLVEFKTHGEKSFADLTKHGVAQSKPQHVAQMQTYGPFYNLEYGLYCAVNKNTDEFHFEWLRLDPTVGALHVEKAGRLIYSQIAPPKISEAPTFFKCKRCHFNGICHSGHIPEKNCRSCAFATPVDNGEWHCGKFDSNPPKDFIAVGCGEWVSIV